MLADGIFLLYVKVWYSLWQRRMFSGFRSVWIRLRSWRTIPCQHNPRKVPAGFLTGNAGQQLAGKVLDLAVWERHEVVALQKVKHALAEQIHDNADVPAVVEAISEMNASVPVFLIIGSKCLQDSEFDLTGLAILLHRPDDFYGNELAGDLVLCLHDFAESALSEQLDHLVCRDPSISDSRGGQFVEGERELTYICRSSHYPAPQCSDRRRRRHECSSHEAAKF